MRSLWLRMARVYLLPMSRLLSFVLKTNDMCSLWLHMAGANKSMSIVKSISGGSWYPNPAARSSLQTWMQYALRLQTLEINHVLAFHFSLFTLHFSLLRSGAEPPSYLYAPSGLWIVCFALASALASFTSQITLTIHNSQLTCHQHPAPADTKAPQESSKHPRSAAHVLMIHQTTSSPENRVRQPPQSAEWQ